MHSMAPAKKAEGDLRVKTVGGPHCEQPYEASLFNISAMSFGSLSANAILALNNGAKAGRLRPRHRRGRRLAPITASTAAT